jgi:hypothetical protein
MKAANAQLTTPNGTSIYATTFSKFSDCNRQFPEISIADHLAKLRQDDLLEVLECILESHLDAKLNEIKLEHPDDARLVAHLVAEIDWTLASTASWEVLARMYASDITFTYMRTI